MQKKWMVLFFLAVSLTLLLSACGAGSGENETDSVASDSSSGAGGDTLEISATNWSFNQETFEVPAGETTISFTSKEGVHGISIPDLGVDLTDGESATVDLEPGEYPFSCNIACGQGHADMQAKIVVK
ncbi:cupredoxin domain-containing protein [Novibacillus thermophilus]|uniref:EfeO-type cupredoxin-like domain-containing protein n=1 Tax=Novibacillus thermophilus TaxID=1471761 RepID=A0A1U9K6T5_9BACL|nr:cupredoxin domain-containing protein [Novibacillus thermophilus]AQS55741.1 hypothetical protein B0W44_07990 [Novibacillus thermophilus]